MEKLRLNQEIGAVKMLGEQIGYGHLMALATACWRADLRKKYGPGVMSGAFIGVCSFQIKDTERDDIMKTVEMYDGIIEKRGLYK